MDVFRTNPRSTATAVVLAFTVLVTACSDGPDGRITGPAPGPSLSVTQGQQGVDVAIAAQERHTDALMHIPGVIGTAVTLAPNGSPAVEILLEHGGIAGLPDALDGVPVVQKVTGRIMAFSDPTTRARPAPLGFSVGHPAITAGTIGARVADGSGNLYILSNNHVLANANNASIGDPEYQPGVYDGGTSADIVANLSAFKTIDFSGGSNTIDAAIALTNAGNVGNGTPLDDGYGAPASQIFDDADHNGTFDNRNDLLGVAVKKYGRTTKLTHGTITAINATVSVCYEVVYIFCVKSATFVDQLIVTPGTFSDGGDSGSLIVTDDATSNPVALLFAGSSSETIANRIDLVLNYFGVHVDGGSGSPPPPTTDLAITGVTGPASVTQGNSANISVTVQNVGSQNVSQSFDVRLRDVTASAVIGTQSVAGLNVGASKTLTFTWNTSTSTSTGSHTLRARQRLADDNAGNDVGTTAVTVNAPSQSGTMHVGDLDVVYVVDNGKRWAATVEITAHDASHNPLNGVVVLGSWSKGEFDVNQCTTSGAGQCVVLAPSIRGGLSSVTFTVTSLTKSGLTYAASSNHDPDGDSNGTSITVAKP
jgi:CARDB